MKEKARHLVIGMTIILIPGAGIVAGSMLLYRALQKMILRRKMKNRRMQRNAQ